MGNQLDAIARNIYKEKQFEAALHKLKMKDRPAQANEKLPEQVDKAQLDLIKDHQKRMMELNEAERNLKNG